jgi:hypothetical protein
MLEFYCTTHLLHLWTEKTVVSWRLWRMIRLWTNRLSSSSKQRTYGLNLDRCCTRNKFRASSRSFGSSIFSQSTTPISCKRRIEAFPMKPLAANVQNYVNQVQGKSLTSNAVSRQCLHHGQHDIAELTAALHHESLLA